MLSMTKIGRTLRKEADRLGLSDAEVARRSSIGERTYGHYVDDRSKPPLDKLVRICHTLKITPNYLLNFEELSTKNKLDLNSLRQALNAAIKFYIKYSPDYNIPTDSLIEITIAAYEEAIKEEVEPTSNVIYMSMVNKFKNNRVAQ